MNDRRREPRLAPNPTPLGQGIRRLVAALGLEPRLLEHRALALWPEVVGEAVGEAVGRHTQADAIRRGELFVSIRKDAMRHRLIFERERIRQAINQRLGREVVRSIIFVK